MSTISTALGRYFGIVGFDSGRRRAPSLPPSARSGVLQRTRSPILVCESHQREVPPRYLGGYNSVRLLTPPGTSHPRLLRRCALAPALLRGVGLARPGLRGRG